MLSTHSNFAAHPCDTRKGGCGGFFCFRRLGVWAPRPGARGACPASNNKASSFGPLGEGGCVHTFPSSVTTTAIGIVLHGPGVTGVPCGSSLRSETPEGYNGRGRGRMAFLLVDGSY